MIINPDFHIYTPKNRTQLVNVLFLEKQDEEDSAGGDAEHQQETEFKGQVRERAKNCKYNVT